MLSKAKDKVKALVVGTTWRTAAGICVLGFPAMAATALAAGSSRGAGGVVMGARCDMAVLGERLHLNYRRALPLN